MPKKDSTRLSKRVRKRYAELLLRRIHQCGGRDRYVSVEELEDALGLEAELILRLCRTRLRGEVHVAERPPARLMEAEEFQTPVEQAWLRCLFTEPHVRIRPRATRLTEDELVGPKRRPAEERDDDP